MASYWFIPINIFSIAIIAAIVLPILDIHYQDALGEALPWIKLSSESARLLFATIMGSMVSVVGLVFSLTVLTLSLASSQFGPRLLRTFITNRSTQFALGIFLATSIYALLLLAMIRDEEYAFVPYLSLSFAVLVTTFNLLYLIYFINDIAQLMQAPNVVCRVADDFDRSIDRLFPASLESEKENEESFVKLPTSWLAEQRAFVYGDKEGYIQGVDTCDLVELAKEEGVTIRVLHRPGAFIAKGLPLIQLWPSIEISDEFNDKLNRIFVVGKRRTPRQDVECALNELVEVAVRSLSSGINDPFTAMTCIDRLGASLGRLAGCPIPASGHWDSDEHLRVVMPVVVFNDVLEAAFNQIRQNSRTNPAVLIRLLEALTVMTHSVVRESDFCAIRRQMEMIDRMSAETVQERNDREEINNRLTILSNKIT